MQLEGRMLHNCSHKRQLLNKVYAPMQLRGLMLHNGSQDYQLLTKGRKAVFRDGGEAQGIQLVWNGWQSPWVLSIRRCPWALSCSACIKHSTHQ